MEENKKVGGICGEIVAYVPKIDLDTGKATNWF